MSKYFHFLTHTRRAMNVPTLGAGVRTIAMILVLVISMFGTNHGVASAAGNTYYINNTVACSESGPGSMAQPFCTITKGADVAVAGDTVKVVAGTYAETVIVTKSGVAGSPITFQGSPGVTVTGVVPGFGSGFAMTGVSYVVIDGFTVTNTPYKGIYVDSSNHITISNNDVSNAGVTSATHPYEQGIYLKNTTYSTITGNSTHHNTCIGIRLINNSDYNVISDNISYANFSVVETDAAGIELTGASHNTVINNITYSNEDSGINVYVNGAGVGSSYNLIIGNLSYENGDHGIDHNNSPYNTVIGNTVHGNGTVGINFEGEATTGSHHATVMNNISVGNGFTPPTGSFGGNLRVDTPSITGSVIDYNLFNRESASVQIIWNNTNYNTLAAFRTAEPTQEVHGREGDPLFIAPVPSVLRATGVPYVGTSTVGDYHLSGGSPAIDSANSDAPNQPSTDIEGNSRIDDPATANTGAGTRTYDDRGAYEFQLSGSNVLPTVTTQAVTAITQTTATGNGNVTSLGLPNPSQHGVVWSTSANPTTLDNKTTDGAVSATGAFTSNITGLTAGTLYHVRAYATNAAGTAYGEDVTFTASSATANTGFMFANATVGSNGVTNQNNGWTSNNLYTTFNGSDTADYGFPDLGIPADSTIDGIEVTIEGKRSGTTPDRNLTARLWNTSALTPDAYTASKIATLTDSDTTQTLGGPTDKWGTTWTVADFADATFKIRVGVNGNSGDADLDAVAVKVYYTLPLPKGTTTTVNCGAGTPTVTYGTSISCVATVVRSAGSYTPAGNVAWTTNGSGTFATSPCVLAGSNGTSTCSVTYTPKDVGTGSHLISATYAGNANFLASSGSQTVTVNPTAVTVTGITANNKVYNANTVATLNTNSAAVVGVLAGDTVTLNKAAAAGAFADKSVGVGKVVTISGLTLTGVDAGNYLVTQPTATADITAKDLTVNAVGVNKVYDGTTAATVNLSTDALAGDTVTAVYTSASFANKNAGANKPVTVTGISISGADVANYTLLNTTANATANITAFNITVTAHAKTKFVGTTDPALTYSFAPALFSGDAFTGGLTRAAGETVGTYAIQQGTLSAGGNYNIHFVGTNLAIIPIAPSNLSVYINGGLQEEYVIDPSVSTRDSYASVNGGPVKLISNNDVPVMAAERVVYKVQGTATSFTEMMGLPNSQLDTTYWLPWYNNVDLDTQLRFANVSNVPAVVHIFIGGSEVTPVGGMSLPVGASTRQSFTGVNNGPVKIVSNVPIVAAERVIYKVQNKATSFSEMMALPASQLNKTYWLPWYNNVDLDTQLRFANVNNTPASVRVYIGGVEMQGSPFNLGANESTRVSFANINGGPVKIVSDVNIVAAERVVYKVQGIATSFTEMMGLPESQLDTMYWLPWYNNVDLDTQLRLANVSDSTATVHIYVGGTEVTPVSGLSLVAGESTRVSYVSVNNGPVRIVSNVPIVVAERVIYKVAGTATSFSEMMGLPANQLDTVYWLPWYNNVDLDTQLRFGVP